MKLYRHAILLPLLFLAAYAGVPAQAQESDAPRPLPQREKIVLGVAGRLTANAPLHLARELGEFEKENLTVELAFHKPSDNFVLLSTGRIDVALGSPSAAFFNAVAAGSEIKLVAPNGYLAPKNGFWVSKAWLKDRPWSPALMKGQVIASPAGVGTTTAYAAQIELAKAGLTLKDISWRGMAVSDLLVALEGGAVNIAMIFDPTWRNADPSKVQFVAAHPGDVTGGYFFGASLLGPKRAVGEAFVRALTRTVRLYLQNDFGANSRVVAALAKELQMPEQQVRTMSDSVRFPIDMPLRKDLAEILQNCYLSTPGILTYAQALPDDRLIDRGFTKAVGVRAPRN